MRFAILKAMRASRATRERVGDTDAHFLQLLREPGQQWDVFDVEHGAFPERLDAYQGLVITGSPANAYDHDPWIVRLVETAGAAHRQGIPLLGICFGHQVVARALGGAVGPNPAGWDLGIAELTPTAAGRRWAPLAAAPQPLRILETHSDVVTRLPPGAVCLAASPRTEVEIFTVGERVLCLQGHPEMDVPMVRELLDKREARGLLDPARAAEGRASLANEPHRAFLEEWLRRFLREGRLPAAA